MSLQSPRPLLAACIAALSLLPLAGCNQGKAMPVAKPPPEVVVTTAHRASVPATIELPGRTSPFLIAQVRARVDGIVQRRLYQEGAPVKANEPLYQIDPAPFRVALHSAEATLQKTQANLVTTSAQLDRYKPLVAENAISKQTYDNAVSAQGQAAADVAAARAAVEGAKINLGYTSVAAPIAGLSGLSQVTQGAYVQGSSATLLTSVQQIDPIYVDLRQSSVEGLQLRSEVASGQIHVDAGNRINVRLVLEDGKQYPLAGSLSFNGTTVDPATGSVALRAVFPNPKHVLLPGMFVRAQVDQGMRNAFLVPARGVTHNPQGQATVMVVDKDSKLAPRVVQASGLSGNNWVIDTGLNDGEQVVVSGGQNVPAGVPVRTVAAAQGSMPLASQPAPAGIVPPLASNAKQGA